MMNQPAEEPSTASEGLEIAWLRIKERELAARYPQSIDEAAACELLVAALQAEPGCALPDDFADRVLTAIDAEPQISPKPARQPAPHRVPWMLLVATGNALLLIVVALALIVFRTPEDVAALLEEQAQELEELRATLAEQERMIGLYRQLEQLQDRSEQELPRRLQLIEADRDAAQRQVAQLVPLVERAIALNDELAAEKQKLQRALVSAIDHSEVLEQQLAISLDASAWVERVAEIRSSLERLRQRGAAEVAELRRRIAERGDAPIASGAFEPVSRSPSPLVAPVGRVSTVAEDAIEIDLGATQGLAVGVRFAVYDDDFAGEPLFRGVIEVVQVGEDRSQARRVAAETSEAFQPGARLYNPLFRPRALIATAGPVRVATVGRTPAIEAIRAQLAQRLAELGGELQDRADATTTLVLVEQDYHLDERYIQLRMRRQPMLHVARLADFIALPVVLEAEQADPAHLMRQVAELSRQLAASQRAYEQVLDLIAETGSAGRTLVDSERERHETERALRREIGELERQLER
jgi:hypothetical protein